MWPSCRVRLARLSEPPLRSAILSMRWSSQFRVIEHEVRTQHTRQWPRGTEIGFENALKLFVKQYVPLKQKSPTAGDITFIAAHANGFPKVRAIRAVFIEHYTI